MTMLLAQTFQIAERAGETHPTQLSVASAVIKGEIRAGPENVNAPNG